MALKQRHCGVDVSSGIRAEFDYWLCSLHTYGGATSCCLNLLHHA
jgi:hypothetical protein